MGAPHSSKLPIPYCDSDEDVKNVVEFLLNKGAEVNARNDDGATALHWACYKGYLESARLLLDHGAALEAKDEDNETPLHWASCNNKLDVVKELVQQGADIFAKSEDDKTPLDLANRQVAEYLLGQYKEKVWMQEG